MDQLISLVNEGDWSNARIRANQLKKTDESSDIFWVLNSTIYQAEGNSQGQYLSIILGLSKNPYNHELYYMLGEYYSNININQAVICMQQALLYCSSENDYEYINSCMSKLTQFSEYNANPTTILITSHNDAFMLENCINNIQKTILKDTYEILVVDNSFQDNTINYLNSQNIRFIKSTPNTSYSQLCNLGVQLASKDSDILFLHGDVILTPNSFFWLKMGLYENNNIGATGAVTNLGNNNQSIAVHFDTKEEYLINSIKTNLPSNNPYELKLILSEFCTLIKREAISSIDKFDDYLCLANYCMADYGISLSTKGYQLLLCHNAFVYHENICSLDSSDSTTENTIITNNNYLKEKWGTNITYYLNLRYELIGCINADSNDHICVLEVGCGCGTTLSKIQYLFPNSTVYGIELMDNVADLGKNIAPIIAGNIEDMKLDYNHSSMDYILFGDVLEHLRDPAATITRLKKYLKPEGKIIASIPNLMHLSVIIPLLKGDFSYADEGLLDRTHIHFFTKNEIIKMFEECGYRIERLDSMSNPEAKTYIESNREFINHLYKLPGIAPALDFESFQYLVVAKNTSVPL